MSNSNIDNPQNRYLIYDKLRTCLRCRRPFKSTGPENRICGGCRWKPTPYSLPKIRGVEQRLIGEE